MPPALPPRARVFLTWALPLAALLLAGPALAMRVRVLSVRENGGYLWLNARFSDLLTPRLRQGLERGMPATLLLHVDLWRRRRGWFDRLEGDWRAQARVIYDVWAESYKLERGAMPPFHTTRLDTLETELARPFLVRLAPVASLEPGQPYYLSVDAVLKPLTVEDAREIEGWLSGEVKSKRRAGLGAITALPLAMFDAVRNLVGLGDQSAHTQSEDFRSEELARE